MTEREWLKIARVVGKPHNDVMKAIRKMEPAWTKVHGGNFSLMQRTIQTNNGGKLPHALATLPLLPPIMSLSIIPGVVLRCQAPI